MTISPEKQQRIEDLVGDISESLGRLIGSLIATAIIAGVMYAILHFLIGLTATYLQVFGVILILDYIKNFLKK